MRKFISTHTWRDNTDGHLYHEGEKFPFDGREVEADRLEALASGRNRAGLRLIRAEEDKAEAVEAPKEKAPEKAKEPRKTATPKRTAKKK